MNAQGGEGDKGSNNLIWGIFFILGIFLLIWYLYKAQILYAYLMIKRWELYFLDLISYALPAKLIDNRIYQMLEYVETFPDSQNLNTIYYIAIETGRYLSFITAPFVFISLYYIWKHNAVMRYRTNHSMSSLVAQEKSNWPQIMPVCGLDLVGIDIDQGPWAMALSPMQFCKKHDLLTIETVADRKSPWKVQGVKKATVIKEKAQNIFLAQIGPYWEGEHELPPHRKALFALFLARIEHDSVGAKELIEDLAISYSNGKIDYAGVEPLLRKHRNSKAARKCVQNHAFVMTVLAAMLELARTDGVLATADFIWLKPMDRELWYVLNCVGRQVPFCEVAGVFAHFKTEKELGRPIFKPVIEQAVVGLELAMEKILLTDDD